MNRRGFLRILVGAIAAPAVMRIDDLGRAFIMDGGQAIIPIRYRLIQEPWFGEFGLRTVPMVLHTRESDGQWPETLDPGLWTMIRDDTGRVEEYRYARRDGTIWSQPVPLGPVVASGGRQPDRT